MKLTRELKSDQLARANRESVNIEDAHLQILTGQFAFIATAPTRPTLTSELFHPP